MVGTAVQGLNSPTPGITLRLKGVNLFCCPGTEKKPILL